MKADEIREIYLSYFEQKAGHKRLPSAPLVPENDPSLLFIGAGMAPFKDMFQGSRRLPYTRIATSQKCLRVGDLEKVGFTSRHHTFFEMLGNFSFGDYFKEEAITWAWDLLTRELKVSPDRLFASVYEKDDEAYAIWHKKIGLAEKRIYRFGEALNFWPANAPSQGPNGPCGPCSEIYYDFGEAYACKKPGCDVGCDCDRFVEIWNLVFTEYNRREDGVLEPLPQKNIDTGAGLERWAAMLQGVVSNFDTDLFQPILRAIREIVHPMARDPRAPGRLRRIADHLRAVVFCIADGVNPSNEDRGYVVRRLIRKAITDAYLMGHSEPFLYKLVPIVADVMQKPYPEIRERLSPIQAPIREEEERFLETLEQGMNVLNEAIDELRGGDRDTLDGERAFKLHDTFGFPVELTQSLLQEHGFKVDMEGFRKKLEEARELSRRQSGFAKDIFQTGALLEMKKKFPPTVFQGYRKLKLKSTVLAIIRENRFQEEAREGDEVLVLLDETPFYAEGGGQVGDTGFLQARKLKVSVNDTRRDEGYFLHHCKVVQGTLRPGTQVEAVVNAERRANIVRNHDATHLLHAALRQVLGPHAEQAGSVVAPDYLRFDFKHGEKLTPEQLRAVEDLVNQKVLEDVEIEKIEDVPIEEARRMGAIMLFGEKYGEKVRVVRTKDNFSIELCGGCHGERTSPIGLFKIVSEESVGSGVRRIVALTGPRAVEAAAKERDVLEQLMAELRVGRPEELLPKIRGLNEQIRKLEASLKKRISGGSLEEIVAGAKVIGQDRVVFHRAEDDLTPDQVRSMMDTLVKRHQVAAAAIISQSGGKAFGIVGVRGDLVAKGVKAGDLARAMGAAAGASGGGKDHMAQFGLAEIGRAGAAFDVMHELVTKALQGGGALV